VRKTGIILLLLWCVPLNAQEITARATVDSTHYLVGDWIHVHIDLLHPRGTTFQPIVGDTLGSFSVVERQPLERVSETETRTTFVVSYYDSGNVVIPPMQFLYASAGDTASRVIETNPVNLFVSTVAVDTSKDFRDIKPPFSIAMTLAEILLYVAIVLAILAAAYLGYRYWKKKNARRPLPPAYVPPPKPAHVIALEKLGRLKEKKLWQQGLLKEYYSETTDIVREYIEKRFKVRALEQTTDEILEAISVYNLPDEATPSLESMLRNADMVKFAKFQPSVTEHEILMTSAYAFVEKTKLTPARTGSQVQQRTGAHVSG